MRGFFAVVFGVHFTCSLRWPRKPPVYLERANVLPVQLDDHFKFRKQDLFFNDPRNYAPTVSEPMRFYRMSLNYGVVTPRDQDEVTGNYFTFFWWAHRRADVTVRMNTARPRWAIM